MPRRARTLLLVVAAGVVALALTLSLLVSGDDDAEPAPATRTPSAPAEPTSPPPVELTDLDTLTTAVTRDTFCGRVADEAVEAALGVPPTATTEYADGDSVQVTGRVRDIAHEFGCTWSARTGHARAWVFAPPVARSQATSLVRDAREEDGCRPVAGAPDFGSPSLALSCRGSRGTEVSYRGLFGDAWLTCVVADRRATARADAADVVERAGRWCAAVLGAATA